MRWMLHVSLWRSMCGCCARAIADSAIRLVSQEGMDGWDGIPRNF